MKTFRLIVIVSVALIACRSQKTAQTLQSGKLPNTLLWEVSGNGLKAPSFLFGTMHVLCSGDAILSDSMKWTLGQVRSVFFEINMDDMGQMMGVLRYIRMNGNKRLPDLLSKEDYQKVKDYFSKHPSVLPLSMMETFKPYFVAALMSEQKMPCPDKEGMEQVILKAAKLKHLPIDGLETAAFQASVFDSIPYQQQAMELVKMVDSTGVDDKESAELQDIYRRQDLEKMQELTVQEDDLIGKNIDVLLYNRNARWAIQIDSIIHLKPTLFAVGAAHLPGAKGVISLLKQRGYTLRPVKN